MRQMIPSWHGMKLTIHLKHGRRSESDICNAILRQLVLSGNRQTARHSALRSYIKEIGYGNEIINSDLSSYWMQSELKISPVEQVELLTDLYNNDFGFSPENVNAVKDSICLYSADDGTLSGKQAQKK